MPDTLTLTATDGSGSFAAYIARPETPNGAALIAIQEIFGVNANMRQIADGFAARGYLVLVPDLFWRIQPGIELDPGNESDLQQAFAHYQAFDVDAAIADLDTTIDTARTLAPAGKVGTVGYCLGGYLAYLSAVRTSADAAVGYYGVGIETKLDEAAALDTPLMLHIAGKDDFVPPKAQRAIFAALDGHPKVRLHDYPERDHAFARPGGDHYHAGDAALADGRSAEFLKSSLVSN